MNNKKKSAVDVSASATENKKPNKYNITETARKVKYVSKIKNGGL